MLDGHNLITMKYILTMKDNNESIFLIILLVSILIFYTIITLYEKDHFKKVLFSSILITIVIIELIVFLSVETSLKLFSSLNQPEILASIMVAIPTISTWMMDSKSKKELERINNLQTAQVIRDNLETEKNLLIKNINNLSESLKNKQLTIFELLLILNSLEAFLLKIEEVAEIYRRLNTITFKMDLDKLYDETYILFEKGIESSLFPINGDITNRFGESFTSLIKNKLLYGIEIKNSSDIYRDLAFILLNDRFKKLYYINFVDIFEKNEKLSSILNNNDNGNEIYFENKEFIKCNISNLTIPLLGTNNSFIDCNTSELNENKLKEFLEIGKEFQEEVEDEF